MTHSKWPSKRILKTIKGAPSSRPEADHGNAKNPPHLSAFSVQLDFPSFERRIDHVRRIAVPADVLRCSMLSMFLVCWRPIVGQLNNVSKDGISLFHHTRRSEQLRAIIYSLKQRKPNSPIRNPEAESPQRPRNSELNF